MKEIRLRKNYLENELIDTVYFGGGTPSLLTETDLQKIITALADEFTLSPDLEMTFEANPDDITSVALESWKRQGINRLSIGIQSFFEEDLKWMNRAHSALQASHCISLARDAGFSNMSIDLIFGTPTLSDEKWQTNMSIAADLQIPHLSCYALTVEPGTALDALTRKKKVMSVNTEDQARQFLMMTDYLQSRGYEHYEISNLALPGKRSKHNSSYWSGAKYLGLGPSAHSFNGASRQWNVSNNALYIAAINKGEIPFEIETLTTVQRQNEYIMTSLRTKEGMDLDHLAATYGNEYAELIAREAQPFVARGHLIKAGNKLILTREGKLFADGIAAGLFTVDVSD